MKILGNNCILGTIELLSESFTLVEKTGFDAGMYYEFIFTCKTHSKQVQTILTDNRAVVSSSRLGELWQEDPRRHLPRENRFQA